MTNYDEFATIGDLIGMYFLILIIIFVVMLIVCWAYEKYVIKPYFKKINKRLRKLEEKTRNKN